MADARRDNGIRFGDPAFRKEDAIVFVEGDHPGALRLKRQMDAVGQAFRIVFGVYGSGIDVDDGLVILPHFPGKPFQNGAAGPGHQCEPGGGRGTVRPGFGEQSLAVAEAFRHPSGLPVPEFPVPGIVALAAPPDSILQAAADIRIFSETQIIPHLVHYGG